MKRQLAKLLVFLVLGAIVNVAVAWGFAVQRPAQVPSNVDNPDPDAHAWVMGLIDAYEFSDQRVLRLTGTRHNRIRTFTWLPSSKMAQSAAYVAVQHQRVGWPTLSMQGSKSVYSKSNPWNPWHAPSTPGITHVEHEWAFELPSAQSTFDYERTGFLALFPLWPGFAINSVFYAVILWLVFAAPFALRRQLRIWKGKCLRCGYPRGTSDNCTECGEPLTPART